MKNKVTLVSLQIPNWVWVMVSPCKLLTEFETCWGLCIFISALALPFLQISLSLTLFKQHWSKIKPINFKIENWNCFLSAASLQYAKHWITVKDTIQCLLLHVIFWVRALGQQYTRIEADPPKPGGELSGVWSCHVSNFSRLLYPTGLHSFRLVSLFFLKCFRISKNLILSKVFDCKEFNFRRRSNVKLEPFEAHSTC